MIPFISQSIIMLHVDNQIYTHEIKDILTNNLTRINIVIPWFKGSY